MARIWSLAQELHMPQGVQKGKEKKIHYLTFKFIWIPIFYLTYLLMWNQNIAHLKKLANKTKQKNSPSYHSGVHLISFWFLFYFVFCMCGLWKFPGQGSNPCHSSNQCHSSDNARSLTCWELLLLIFDPWRFLYFWREILGVVFFFFFLAKKLAGHFSF